MSDHKEDKHELFSINDNPKVVVPLLVAGIAALSGAGGSVGWQFLAHEQTPQAVKEAIRKTVREEIAATNVTQQFYEELIAARLNAQHWQLGQLQTKLDALERTVQEIERRTPDQSGRAPYRKHYELTEWLSIPRSHWMACAQGTPMGLSKDPVLEPMLHDLRALIPVPGREWKKERHVLLEYGKRIAAHDHPEWVALFYVDPGDPPVAIIVEGERVEPEPGLVIVLPPGTWH